MGNKMNKVLPGLYIGSARDARDAEELRINKISHILTLLENFKPDFPDKEYMILSIADSPTQNISCYFSQCNVFIHKARRTGNVLVHCQMGVSRSATIVVAYIMTVTRMSWRNALAALKAVRPFINPNLGFQRQLMAFEQKFLEEERTRLKALFPLSQFNDVVHCDQLLETYRLSRLRNEQPMDVDVYPLALNAYGPKDFSTLKRESSTPAGVIFCGPVSDACNEEDCLVQRFQRIQLTETFTKVDTFSCGPRPSSAIVTKKKAPELSALPSASSLDDDVLAPGSFAREKISGNYLLSTSPNCAVQEEPRPDDRNSTDAATLEMIFSNSEFLKNSANNDAKKSALQESGSSLRTEVLNDAAVDSIFSMDSVGGSKNSISRLGSEERELSTEKRVSDQVTEKELRKIGKAYLRNNVRIWHDMSDTEEDDDDEILSTARNVNNDPSKLMKRSGNNPSQNKIAGSDPTQWIKITNYDPTQSGTVSNDPIQLTKITSNFPTQNKVASNDSTQLIKITSNDPCQAKSNGPTQERLGANSEEVITLLPSQSQLDRLFDS